MKYSELTPREQGAITILLKLEARKGSDQIFDLFLRALNDYRDNKFSYDGATFVRERFKSTTFELAAFIHDWRNSNGYVGWQIDREMFRIMRELDYPTRLIVGRWIWCWFTGLNVLRHKIKGTLKKELPTNLYN